MKPVTIVKRVPAANAYILDDSFVAIPHFKPVKKKKTKKKKKNAVTKTEER